MNEKKTIKPQLKRHIDDDYIDEVIFRLEGTDKVIRTWSRERYKTSGMSGDEWRFSWPIQFGVQGADKQEDIGRAGDMRNAFQQLYPTIIDRPDLRALVCSSIDLFRKGTMVYRMTNDGKSAPLEVAVGSANWGYISAVENGGMSYDYEGLDKLCSQPGCRNEPVSVYRLKKEWCGRCGKDKDAPTFKEASEKSWRKPLIRQFCRQHLRRGDCGLEDSDENYEVLAGPGPDDHEMDPSKESPSVFGGMIYCDIDDDGEIRVLDADAPEDLLG